ncbi:DUF5979 domain-containing protein, partial [Cellulomonas composti]|uniref:DUF5979 domain-containing protein n=1 Tax=Cellulomonas composti TaxID=266130 RepID=UPI001C99592D
EETSAPGVGGGFSLRKLVDGIDVADLPDGADTEFTVEYYLDGADTPAGTVTVTADGAWVRGATDLPSGTVVTFGEVDLPDLVDASWTSATFAPASVTVDSGTTTEVTLTNVALLDGAEGGDGGDGDGGDGGDGGDELASTGTDVMLGVIGSLVLVAAGGILLLVGRRRRTATEPN